MLSFLSLEIKTPMVIDSTVEEKDIPQIYSEKGLAVIQSQKGSVLIRRCFIEIPEEQLVIHRCSFMFCTFQTGCK
ncbi:hypothetical protein SCA6_012439 [Theobroma cacao]